MFNFEKMYRTSDIFVSEITKYDQNTDTIISLGEIPFIRVREENGLINDSKEGYTFKPMGELNFYYYPEEFEPITDYLSDSEIKEYISRSKIKEVVGKINSKEKSKVKRMDKQAS